MGDRRTASRPLVRIAGVLAWAGAVGSAVFATLRLLGIDHNAILISLVSLTPYLTVAAVIPVVFAVAVRRWPAAALALLALVALTAEVVPRAIASSGPHPSGPHLRILSINLHHGEASPAELVALVRRDRIDVLAVAEYTTAAKTGLRRAGLGGLLRYTDTAVLSGLLGTGIYSRFPLSHIISVRRKSLTTEVQANVRVPGARTVVVRVIHGVHVKALKFKSARRWLRQLDELPRAEPGVLRIIAGDFNATLDHSAFRAVLDRGYADAAERVGRGLDPTWPSGHRFGLAIDHVLVDQRIGVDRVRMATVDGTDHRGLIADITLPAQP